MMDYTIQEGLLYSEDHEWVRVEDGKAFIGISGYAAHHLGDIVFVELPEVDTEVQAGNNIGVIESVKAVADMHTPVSGMVVEINEELETSPELLNQDSYTNYIAVIEINNQKELAELMDATVYQKYCEQLD